MRKAARKNDTGLDDSEHLIHLGEIWSSGVCIDFVSENRKCGSLKRLRTFSLWDEARIVRKKKTCIIKKKQNIYVVCFKTLILNQSNITISVPIIKTEVVF